MEIAEVTSKLSSARRLKVGSVIVRDGKILATGYNGTPTGWDNNCEDIELWTGTNGNPEDYPFEGKFWIQGSEVDARYRLKTKKITLHSEANAISKIARSTESSVGSTLFCTHAPCIECAKLIYQSGIKKVWFKNHYRDNGGLEFLEAGGIEVEKYNNPT